MSNVPKSIEAFFYEKLVNSALFGEPKEGLLDSLKERITAGTDEQFDRAAEIIIRERKSGAFPALAVCLQAIERASREPLKPIANQPKGGERITKDTYHAEALAFGRRIIINREEPIRWGAWRRYYEALGLTWAAQQLGPESTRHEWTVPADMPSQFDRHWVDPNPGEVMPRSAGFYGQDMRRRQADELMDRLPIGLKPKRKRHFGMCAKPV